MEQDNKKIDRIVSLFMSTTLGVLIGSLAVLSYTRSNYIPRVKEVQSGYVSPLDLKIRCENLDKSDGKPETFIDIGNKSYILMYNSDNNPTIMEYETIVPKVVPKYKSEKETK